MPNDEWGTPPKIIELARLAMGSIDFDPASNAKANEVVRAGYYYSKTYDGLAAGWPVGENIWLNPPYSQPLCRQFVEKLVGHMRIFGGQAILITNNSTETQWYQMALRRCSAYCLPSRRISFLEDGKPGKNNRQGQTLFYFGNNIIRFCETFKAIGTVIPLKFCW